MEPAEIIARNLIEADSLLAEGWELRYAHIKELARWLLDGTTVEQKADDLHTAEQYTTAEGYRAFAELLRTVRTERTGQTLAAGKTVEEKEFFGNLLAEMDLHSRVELACAWAAVADPLPLPVCSACVADEFTVACFGNLYADRALIAFSDVLGGVRTLPAEDYASACEEVSDGNADFCILPVESAGDGAMDRFERMIDQYSLFTLLTCNVRLSDEEWIRFALLASAPCRLAEENRLTVPDRLRIQITPAGEALWEVLLAAELLGAKLKECRLIGRAEERARVYQLTFSADSRQRQALIGCLELGYSGYTLTGWFRQLSDAIL